MIHIGNQTAFSAGRLMEPFEFALEHGFTAFEWFPDRNASGVGWDEADLDPAVRDSIRKVTSERGLRLSVHARWQANPLRPDSWPLLVKDAELAADLGAVLLNIHLQTEQGIPAFVNAIQPLVELTAERGIQLAIENTVITAPEDFNDMFDHLSQSAADHVCMCLDVGHANLCAATRNDYLAFMDRLGGHVPIGHLHLHENWGDRDAHLTIFTGPSAQNDQGVRGMLERLGKRNFSGSVILEQWPQPPELLAQAHQRLVVMTREFFQPCRSDADRILADRVPPPQVNADNDGTWAMENPASDALGSQLVPDQHLMSSGLARQLIAGHASHGSWRRRLEMIAELLSGLKASESSTALVDVAVYLRFLGTGQLRCEEDGGHFRPSHHARASIDIQNLLAGLFTEQNGFIIRKILPWLPSGGAMFTRAEPLTRIRDIAHRNDIPSDLKREIKTTLQNKLHRCAGPEDLETSKALLERITAPGAQVSGEFVEQFRVFHRELETFFNAQPLLERLIELSAGGFKELNPLVQAFVEVSGEGDAGLDGFVRVFRLLTDLRCKLQAIVSENPGAATEAAMMADIGLEECAFVQLSRAANLLESGGERSLVLGSLELLELAVVNIRLSGIESPECRAMEAEIDAWRMDFRSGERDHCLRMKATVERCRRLGDLYADRIFEMFASRVTLLGRALGVDERAVQMVCEGDVRGHLVFQLSRLASLLLHELRIQLNMEAWDVLAGGRVCGRVCVADHLDVAHAAGPDEHRILLIRRMNGEEDIPRGVKGLVVGHDLPHLSHLAVRARQAGVVLVACEDQSAFDDLHQMRGKTCWLDARPDAPRAALLMASGVKTPPSAQFGDGATRKPQHSSSPIRPAGVFSIGKPVGAVLVPVTQAEASTCGGKAAGARRLEELVAGAEHPFRTPRGVVLPYAVFEQALEASTDLSRRYHALLDQLRPMIEPDAEVADGLRQCVATVPVPGRVLDGIHRSFTSGTALIVRSSASCEDMDANAGAGLYDSVPVSRPDDLAAAIQRVWSSLWTRRAVSNRWQSGLPHAGARMAVLVQELVPAEFSFILHTANPLTHDPAHVHVEIAPGLGEVLASASERGTPWRMIVDTNNASPVIHAFASFSRALVPRHEGPALWRTMDYSQQKFSVHPASLRDTARRLASVGRHVEAAFGRPQDIEGALVDDVVYLVQSRAQQGLKQQAST